MVVPFNQLIFSLELENSNYLPHGEFSLTKRKKIVVFLDLLKKNMYPLEILIVRNGDKYLFIYCTLIF